MITEDMLSKEAIAIDGEEPVSKLIGKMKEKKASYAYILRGEEFGGVFSYRKLLRSKVPTAELKAKNATKHVTKLDLQDDLSYAAEQMVASDSMMLPVFDKGKFVGVIDAFTVLGNFEEEFLSIGSIADIRPISAKVYTQDSIGKAISTMAENNQRNLLVEDKDGKQAGLLTHESILKKYYIQHLESDYSQRPGSRSRAFKAESGNLWDLPVTNFLADNIPNPVAGKAAVQEAINSMISNRSAVIEVPGGLVDVHMLLGLIAEQRQTEVNNIRFIGLDKLNIESSVRNRIEELASDYGETIGNHVQNIFSMVMHVKEHDKEGRQHRYEVNSRVTFPGGTITGSASDWRPVTAVRSSFEDILKQLESRFREPSRESLRTDPHFKATR